MWNISFENICIMFHQYSYFHIDFTDNYRQGKAAQNTDHELNKSLSQEFMKSVIYMYIKSSAWKCFGRKNVQNFCSAKGFSHFLAKISSILVFNILTKTVMLLIN